LRGGVTLPSKYSEQDRESVKLRRTLRGFSSACRRYRVVLPAQYSCYGLKCADGLPCHHQKKHQSGMSPYPGRASASAPCAQAPKAMSTLAFEYPPHPQLTRPHTAGAHSPHVTLLLVSPRGAPAIPPEDIYESASDALHNVTLQQRHASGILGTTWRGSCKGDHFRLRHT